MNQNLIASDILPVKGIPHKHGNHHDHYHKDSIDRSERERYKGVNLNIVKVVERIPIPKGVGITLHQG